MKIVCKRIPFIVFRTLVMLAIMTALYGVPSKVYADPVAAAPQTFAAVPPPSAPMTNSTITVSTPAAAATPVSIPAPAAAEPDVASESGLATAESKAPNSIKNVMKRLDNAGENITIDDLNSARQAIAKVEVLIELEKKLGELEKAKRERTGQVNSFAAAIPASAFNAPQNPAPQQFASLPVAMPQMMDSKLDIERIFALQGKYKALIRGPNGDQQTIEVGDDLPGNRKVTDITPMSVTLDHDGTKEHIAIKNVDKVFGSTP